MSVLTDARNAASWLRIQQTKHSGTTTRWHTDGSCFVSWWLDVAGENDTQSGHGSGATFHDALREAFKYGDPWDAPEEEAR